jgi:hypothetical protein
MAFLMAGGSMLVRGLDDAGEYPTRYEMPVGCQNILTPYHFIRARLGDGLLRMRPLDTVTGREGVWCLADPGQSYLIYMITGRGRFRLDLSAASGTFDAKWVGMRLGKVFDAFGGTVEGGKVMELSGLDWRPWMLWLRRRA